MTSLPTLRADHKRLLQRRRRALEHKHFRLATRLGIKARRLVQQISRLRRRQVGEFRSFMLDGHPGNVTNEVRRVIGHAYDHFGLRVSSTTDGTHAPGSWHYPSSPENDGTHGDAVDLYGSLSEMEVYQAHQVKRPAFFHELFGPIDADCVKEGVQIAISGELAAQHDNHVHVAPTEDFR